MIVGDEVLCEYCGLGDSDFMGDVLDVDVEVAPVNRYEPTLMVPTGIQLHEACYAKQARETNAAITYQLAAVAEHN